MEGLLLVVAKSKIIIIVAAIILIAGIVMNFIWNVNKDFEPKEISRFTSPDSKVDAVLMQTNGGATTSYGYFLHIVPKGKSTKKGDEIFRADRVEGLIFKWIKVKRLEIKFKKAQILHFENSWCSEEVNNFNYRVDIDLVKDK